MTEKYFKKTETWINREQDLKYWKITMRDVSKKHMDTTYTVDEFKKKFGHFLTHHNLRRAILIGKDLSK